MKKFIRTTDTSDETKPDDHWQLRIEWDGEHLPDIYEAKMTSAKPSAEVMEVLDRITLTRDMVRWLHKSLGELIEAQDGEDRVCP